MATSTILLPLEGVPSATAPPRIAYTSMDRSYLLFGNTTDELITRSVRLPDDYASGLTVKWQYSMASATTNNVAIRAQVMAASAGDNIDTDSFDTLQASSDNTVPGVAGNMKEISLALTSLDSLTAGDYLSLQLGRENGTAGTNASGDMEVWAIALTYTTL